MPQLGRKRPCWLSLSELAPWCTAFVYKASREDSVVQTCSFSPWVCVYIIRLLCLQPHGLCVCSAAEQVWEYA